MSIIGAEDFADKGVEVLEHITEMLDNIYGDAEWCGFGGMSMTRRCKMGDIIEIKAIEFIDSINMYQVDLYNVTKGEYYRVFIPEKDIEQAKDDAFETKSLEDLIGKIIKAQDVALREKVFANTIIINENVCKIPCTSIPIYQGSGHTKVLDIPPTICGLEVHPTKYFLPDNIPFAILKSPQTEFECKLDEEMRKFTNMVAKHLADGFDSPCNYSPLDEEMFDYCGGVEGECEGDDAVECWKRVFKMWRKQDEEEAERRWNEE